MEDVVVNAEVRRRGRQKGQVKEKTIIQDPSFGPYEIHQDEHCFTIVKPMGNGPQDPTFGYFQHLSNALNKMVKLRMVGKGEVSIKEYIKEIKSLKFDIENAI